MPTSPIAASILLGVLSVWSSIIVFVAAASVAWQSDSIGIALTSDTDTFTLDLQASRTVLSSPGGHFKLRVTRDGVAFNTSCLSYSASASAMSEALNDVDPVDDLGGADVVREGDGSSDYNYGYIYYVSAANSSENLASSIEIEIVGSGTEYGCARLSTLGYWGDATNWDTGVVPASVDEVTIPSDSGFVALTEDTTVSTLTINGGALITHDTTCLPGWTPAPGGTSASFGSNKCYRVYSDAASWTQAQSTCARAVGLEEVGSRGGALRGALVTVQGLEENQWVGKMCRGDLLDRDCWVGLTRRYGVDGNGVDYGGGMEWADVAVAGGESRYRSWAMREPSDFERAEGGENCVAVKGSKKLAMEQAEARWYDTKCDSEKPFVCQAFGVSTPFSLTVSTELSITGGYITGAGSLISSALAQVSGDVGEVGILSGATLVNSAGGSMEWSAPSTAGWGGTLRNKGTLTFSGTVSFEAASDGEGFLEDNARAWPAVLNEVGGEIVVESGTTVLLEWLLWNEGGDVLVQGELDLSGAGYSLDGELSIEEGGEARFSKSSFVMHQPEVVVVALQADREVTGHDVKLSSEAGGYYRLAYGGEETRCIDYHASGESVQGALEDLLSVEDEGGVTVRRDGNGKLEGWNYGYRHVVSFDGARDLSTANTLTLSCAGSAAGCGCVDVTGAIAGPGGSRVGCGSASFGAANASTSAEYDRSQCLVQATMEIETVREGSETTVTGGGALVFSGGGQYMLPSMVEPDVEVTSEAEAVCAQWNAELRGAVNVSSGGLLWFAGADSDALDAVNLLHAKAETPGRTSDAIASPPSFNATIVGDVTAESSGEIRLAATLSASLNVLGSLTLAGGGLSGQGRVVVAGSTLIVSGAAGGDEASSLKNGVVLDMTGGGVWSEGDLHARDGATVVNRGVFEVTAEDGATFGAGGDFGAIALLDFDGIDWYPNPLCGDSCTVEPSWENVANGEVVGSASSDALLCFTLLNKGTVQVNDGGRLEWCGAGEGRSNGSILLPGLNSTLVVSDGSLVLEPTANLSGTGVLEFSGGSGHELSETISPLVKVSGYAVVTFAGMELALGRGLTVEDKATVIFSANTSSTSIAGDLTMQGDSLIFFSPPTIEASLLLVSGVGADPPWGPSEGDLDGGEGWGAPSRSSVKVEGMFKWTGGTMSGNARALCEGDSQWGGDPDAPTKTLLNSFHLVNAGDVVWSSGDVIVSSAASFVNRGTLLIEDSDTADEEPSSLCHTTGTTCSTSERRIRSPREGERGWTRDRLGVADSAVAAGGAGSAGGDAASWAWEELSYDG